MPTWLQLIKICIKGVKQLGYLVFFFSDTQRKLYSSILQVRVLRAKLRENGVSFETVYFGLSNLSSILRFFLQFLSRVSHEDTKKKSHYSAEPC